MITTEKYLYYILKTDKNTVQNVISNIDSYYKSWKMQKIDKDTGLPIPNKTRPLNSSIKELKAIQKRIYKFLLKKTELPEYTYGGVPKKDNVRNAKYHQGNKYIFTTDLKSFFPSISHKQVFDLFSELGCTPTISRLLTQLTTHNHQLPQGVATSTLIANLIFRKTGDKISDFAKSNDMKFTTFVDDLTLSSKDDFKNRILEIIQIITNDGYKISHGKTNYKTKNPVITGVVCQNNKLKLERKIYKRLSRLKKVAFADTAEERRHKGLSLYRKRIDKTNMRKTQQQIIQTSLPATIPQSQLLQHSNLSR
jgi:RNA-directed DNA polymerase